jgi:NAD-dependent dihydropyrimidine dehydrogenase PreA subunit
MKLTEMEFGKHQIAGDIGCHLFASLPPFEIGGSTMGYGLGPASNAAFDGGGEKRSISILGDGGFWHNGLSSSIGNAVYNKSDGVIVIVDNFYSAATGGQDILSSRADNASKATGHPIADAVKGVGVKWVRQIDRTYDVPKMREILKEALTTDHEGPKVIVASSECMLNKQRREKPLDEQGDQGRPPGRKPRFGVDEDICTGDHACIRLSGCPSLSLKKLDDPLRDDPVASIDQSCVGCGNCGEVADAAVLCPSFYRADVVHNPGWFERTLGGFASRSDRLAAKPPLARPHRIRPDLTHGKQTQTALKSKPPDPALDQIIKLAVMAVGGQGGGVLTNWIEDCAHRNGYVVQATSVAGVAQRTGATIYYMEMAPAQERAPVFSLDAGRRRRRHPDRRRDDGSRPRHHARLRHPRPHHPDRLLPPGAGRLRKDRARRRHRRFRGSDRGGRNRRAALHRLRHGEDGGRRRIHDLGQPVRRARRIRRPCPSSARRFEDAIKASGRGVEASLRAFAAGFEAARRRG